MTKDEKLINRYKIKQLNDMDTSIEEEYIINRLMELSSKEEISEAASQIEWTTVFVNELLYKDIAANPILGNRIQAYIDNFPYFTKELTQLFEIIKIVDNGNYQEYIIPMKKFVNLIKALDTMTQSMGEDFIEYTGITQTQLYEAGEINSPNIDSIGKVITKEERNAKIAEILNKYTELVSYSQKAMNENNNHDLELFASIVQLSCVELYFASIPFDILLTEKTTTK